jgi:hypothetical protein
VWYPVWRDIEEMWKYVEMVIIILAPSSGKGGLWYKELYK